MFSLLIRLFHGAGLYQKARAETIILFNKN